MNKKQTALDNNKLPIRRRIVHIIVLILGWCLYFYFVWKVSITPGLEKAFIAILKLAVLFLISLPIITFFWIRHNIRLAKKYEGRRKEIPPPPEIYDKDWEGREVIADWNKLRSAKKIKVVIENNRKKFIDLT